MKKLSIIIPAYNVEQYIEKCLTSIQDQAVNKDMYEVIVIVDGADDNTLQIAKEVSERYHNIRVVYQKNEGLSATRNNGLKMATGEYVWFVDSDDWIEPNCLPVIFNKLDGSLDILQLQRRLTYDDTSKNIDIAFISIEGAISGSEVLAKYHLPAPAQFRIYRKSFLIENNIWFYKGILHEDSEFMPRVVYLANSMTSLDCIVYNYYQRTNGNIMSSFRIRNVRDLMTVNNSLYDFSKNIIGKPKREINRLIGLNLNTAVGGYKALSENDKIEAWKLLKSNKHLFVRMLQCDKITYIFEGIMFIISVKIALRAFSMLKN